MNKSNLKWNELWAAGFTYVCTAPTIPTKKFEVKKPDNLDWPENDELISFCDGGPGMNFGGSVRVCGNTAYVDVYID